MGPNDKFDLLIRNANVLDPSQGLSGKRDIGIRYGADRGDRSRASLPSAAKRVMDAGGKLVTPGLIDLHATLTRSGQRSAFPPTN